MYKTGDVVIALNGQGKTRATTGILKVDTSSNQSVANISPSKELTSEYLHFNLKYRYGQLRSLTGDKSRSGLNLKLLRNLDIICPPIDIQKIFSSIVSRIYENNIEKEKSILLIKKAYTQIVQEIGN
jgi:type I restriction enzyme S subunit